MSLVFYYAPWSSAVTVLWALEELGIPHERVKLDLAAKDTHKPAYLALNPNGKVPLIVHDGTPVFESIAILMHLGETFGVEKKLFPAPGIERAQAFQWLAWANVSLGGAVGRYLYNVSKDIPAESRNAKAGEAAKAEAEKLVLVLDGALRGKTWLVGDSFSLVDVHLSATIAWMTTLGFETKPFANVEAWVGRCKARPGFAVAMAP